MKFLSILLSAAALVAAQNQTVTVQVGGSSSTPGGIFQFIPNNLNATAGSVITFQFTGVPGNHSITQSSFTSPCTPLQAGGFDSGNVFIPSQPSATPQWNLTVTNGSTPIWFYCKALIPAPHCAAGMVGAINAPTTGNNTFQNYLNNAHAFQGNSGQGQGALTGQGASASTIPAPIPSGVTLFGGPGQTSTTPNPTPSSRATSLSATGWIGLLAALLGVGLA